MIHLKKGATLGPEVSEKMWFAIGYITSLLRCWYMLEGPTITSGDEETLDHKKGSKHYQGEAIDIRTRNWSDKRTEDIFLELHFQLDPLGFDTVLEHDHIHIEWDPKPGEIFIEEVE